MDTNQFVELVGAINQASEWNTFCTALVVGVLLVLLHAVLANGKGA